MAVVLRADGTETTLDDLSLASMQAAVGGYIERVRLSDNREMWVNEDGISMQLPFNLRATQLRNALAYVDHMPILGDVIIVAPGEKPRPDDD